MDRYVQSNAGPESNHPPASLAPPAELQEFWNALLHLQQTHRALRGSSDFRALHREALAVAGLSRLALPAADRVLARFPDPLAIPDQLAMLDMLGAAYSMNNAYQRAVDVNRRAVSLAPEDARTHYNLAAALMFTGDFAGAEREIARCLRLQPTLWDGYTLQSKVRSRGGEGHHVEERLALLERFGEHPRARERLNLALAREYEGLHDYGRAFDCLVEGNAAGKSYRRYDFQRDEQLFDALMRQGPTAQPAGSGYATDEPILVFGMPRSGTTLVERILSGHPQVKSCGELKQFSMLLKWMSGSPSADLIDADTVVRCRDLDWKELGERYLASTRPLSGQVPRFVDKFPHHFLHAGFLANALPRARMICVRRNPLDTCLGNFREVFSETSTLHGYACDLMDTGRYYILFDRLMAHWQQVFPGRILEVSYESLVADQETQTRAMLEFCGLRWDPACLAFEANRAPTATASAAQVRSPIRRDAVQRWRFYEKQLAPLAGMMAQAGIAVAS
ncbi:MAG TPA: sulfotransferase [Rhodanobacteraceae bacterium]|nr:sulfotransferase [Rhodanobacteraceae bacterium]